MIQYVVDVNLPYYFSLWNSEEYIHQIDINPKAADSSIWNHAKENDLTIITKDSDFSARMLVAQPPPRIIHIKFGNTGMSLFHELICDNWNEILELSKTHKLVNVYRNRIEGID